MCLFEMARKATTGKNVILLMGSTGSGKTCFMHTLAGVLWQECSETPFFSALAAAMQ